MRAVQDTKSRLVKLRQARMVLHSLLAFDTLQTPHVTPRYGLDNIVNLMRFRAAQTHLRLLENQRVKHFTEIQEHVANLDVLIHEHTESLETLHAAIQGPHAVYTTSPPVRQPN